MNNNNKLRKTLATTIFFCLTIICCYGQTTKFNADTSKVISKLEFDKLVENCINLLQSKSLTEISDAEHINIMLSLNTILMGNLKSGHYDQLENIAVEKNYFKDIIKVYPKWTLNRGMGYYFPKLNMELGGTPRPSSYYKITNAK